MLKDKNINRDGEGMLKDKGDKKHTLSLFFWHVFRLFALGDLLGNGALNQDEAYAGYEAWSLLNYGIDSEGYHNSVFLWQGDQE